MPWDTDALRGLLVCPAPHLVQHRLVQLLLLYAQVAHPSQELPGLDEETRAQQEGEDVGFLVRIPHKLIRAQSVSPAGPNSPGTRPFLSAVPCSLLPPAPTRWLTYLWVVIGCGH